VTLVTFQFGEDCPSCGRIALGEMKLPAGWHSTQPVQFLRRNSNGRSCGQQAPL
jgi:hypothetical protein